MCWQFWFLPRDAGIFFLGAVLMFPTVFPLHTMFSPPRPSPPTPHPICLPFCCAHPTPGFFLSLSCRLFPFSNKMNPVIELRITFPRSILHHFNDFFFEGFVISKRSGKQTFLHILLCFSHVSVSSGSSLGSIPSLYLPQAASLIALPPSSSKTVSPWIGCSQPKHYLALEISTIQKLGQTENYTEMGGTEGIQVFKNEFGPG